MIIIEAYSINIIFLNNFIHKSNNVNKNIVLQHKFKNIKINYYDLNNKKILTFTT